MYSRQLGNVMQQDASSIYLADSNLAHRQDIVTRRCSRCTITCFLELGLAKDAFRYARFLMGGRP
jgi:hypothetical protein